MPDRQTVPQEKAERIIRAVAALDAAKRERDAAIVDALKSGASVREVAAASGMSVSQTQNIGHANGWPTAAQKKKWADEKAERERFNEYIAAYRKQHGIAD